MNRGRIVFAMLIGSVLINVVLAHRLRQFSRVIGKTSERTLKSGTAVPSFQAVDLEGHTRTVAYDQELKPTVLYIFTPPCSWCSRNMDNFKALVAREGAEYRFIGLSLSKDGLPQYVVRQGLTIPVYTGLSTEMQKVYKLGGTPETIVVSPEGRVLQDWMGAYVGDQKSQVEAFFHVTLPGLRELPHPEAVKN
jgi:peroxiredoxin